MSNTFSRLDFIGKETDLTKKMFTYLHKTFSPVRKEIHFIPVQKRNGITDCRTEVKFFDKNTVIEQLKDRIINCNGRQKPYIPRWKQYIDTINNIKG